MSLAELEAFLGKIKMVNELDLAGSDDEEEDEADTEFALLAEFERLSALDSWNFLCSYFPNTS